jgi:hypothetical protein
MQPNDPQTPPQAPVPTPPTQPQFATTPPLQAQPVPGTSVDPGKTLGIVGLVMAFVGLQVVGLILSILGFKKSKAVGIHNTVAKAGIIINSIFIGLALIFIPIMIAITVASYNGITERANEASSQSTIESTLDY